MTESTTSYDADHYVQRLDLGEDPFAADFEPDYFYAGANRQALVDQLIHFSRFSQQTVLLLGATGSGSSCLLDKAFFALKEVMDCCYLDAEVIKQEQEIIESLSNQLQLNLREEASVPELVMAIQAIALVDGEPEPILLAVDQAHFLSLESYALLREVVSAGGDLIRLMLAGEYQVEQLAMLAGFNRDGFKRFELEPLSKQEAGEYLLGLLQSVGYAGELPLSGDQLAVLHEQSGGNIADINQLAPKLLVSENDEARDNPRWAIPVAHIAAIGVLVLAVIGGWIYQGLNKPEDEQPVAMSKSAQMAPANPARISQPLPLPALADKQVQPTEELHDERAGKIERHASAGTSRPGAALAPESDSAAEQAGSDSSAETAVPDQPSGQAGQEELAQKPLEPVAAPATAMPTGKTELASETKPGVSDATESGAIVNGASVSGKQAQRTAKTSKASETSGAGAARKPSATAATPVADIPSREQKLLAFPREGYVLQLMGALEEQRAKNFVQKYADQLPVTYFETRLKGKPWFVAVTGPYEGKEQALAGIKQLPTSLQKQRPWARTVASVQSDIRGNRQ